LLREESWPDRNMRRSGHQRRDFWTAVVMVSIVVSLDSGVNEYVFRHA
jgi:hypothetical protein